MPDTDRYGVKTRYSYHQHLPEDMHTVDFRALVKYDHADGSAESFDYGAGWCGGETTFARRSGASEEDDGYLISLVTSRGSHASECWVFSAREIARGPLARVKLPARVPLGFHAKWIRGDRIFA